MLNQRNYYMADVSNSLLFRLFTRTKHTWQLTYVVDYDNVELHIYVEFNFFL